MKAQGSSNSTVFELDKGLSIQIICYLNDFAWHKRVKSAKIEGENS